MNQRIIIDLLNYKTLRNIQNVNVANEHIMDIYRGTFRFGGLMVNFL